MVKKLAKGTKGNAAQYLTRNQALKKLQLPLSQFRRLCILKGIHPREPRKKPHGQHKTYYHTKDINFLLHEPIIKTLREQHAYQKKLRRARARKNEELLHRLQTRAPSYRLDHLVRERYPSFVDALRDLADPLTLVHLFAALPASEHHGIPPKVVHKARRLALEWQAFVVRAHALRKVFISVKGYYFQVEVQGQQITWLVPHATGQVLPADVDYKVMLTFLEFYEVLLGFVNFKLYHSVGAAYPPIIDPLLDKAAAGFASLLLEQGETGSLQQHATQVTTPSTDAAPALELSDDAIQCSNLFKGLVFFLGREVPREQLLLVIRAFGGTVGWEGEGSPLDVDATTITHQIMDRPTIIGERIEGREYIQPQWVFDSANFRVLAPCALYGPGVTPPPHVSPFVDDGEEGYVPDYAEELRRLAQAQSAAEAQDAGAVLRGDVAMEEDGLAARPLPSQLVERQYREELAQEVAEQDVGDGAEASPAAAGPLPTPEERQQQAAQEDEAAAKAAAGLLSKKQRRLVESVEHKARIKRSKVEVLQARKKKLKST